MCCSWWLGVLQMCHRSVICTSHLGASANLDVATTYRHDISYVVTTVGICRDDGCHDISHVTTYHFIKCWSRHISCVSRHIVTTYQVYVTTYQMSVTTYPSRHIVTTPCTSRHINLNRHRHDISNVRHDISTPVRHDTSTYLS